MRQKLSLYINNKKADLSKDIQISLNYSFSDLENPTIVKNSFSKTIDLLGTKANDAIFNYYFDTRHKIISFDPTERMPFLLYLGSDLLQSGYCKLDNVTRTNGIWKYQITLFGGIGDFFYSISSSTLEDLSTYFNTNSSINKELVFADWNKNNIGISKDICWIPEYGGIYDDFNNGKVYSTLNEYVELPNDVDEWLIGDHRSYYQRPGAYVSEIIKGICSNSGFDVSIDNSFTTTSNPYWDRLVCSFPMLDLSNKEQRWINSSVRLSDASVSSQDGDSSIRFNWYDGSSSKNFSSFQVVQFSLQTDFQLLVDSAISNRSNISFNLTLYYYDTVRGTWNNTGNVVKIMSENAAANYEPKSGETVVVHYGLQNFSSAWKAVLLKDSVTGVVGTLTTQIWEFDPLVTENMTNVKFGFEIYFNESDSAHQVLMYTDKLSYKYPDPTSIRSNRKIHFQDVANNKIKQSDFLLSWSKMFGMLFKQDKNTGHIDILSRNSFFRNYSVLDWTDKLDLSKDMIINPLTYDNRYYDFKFGNVKSSYIDAYEKEIGKEYGIYSYDTEYGLNKDSKNLLDGTVFNTPITTTEYLYQYRISQIDNQIVNKDPIYDSQPRPSNFNWDGNVRNRNNNDMQLYFRLSKSLFGTGRNGASWVDIISDDTPTMVYNQEYSYINYSNDTSAYCNYINYIPRYVDYIASGTDGFGENFSLHFGRPAKTYNGQPEADSSATLYSRFWESYITDLYDKNNKIVTAYFSLEPADILSFDFKNFVFVDGVIYHVNKIIDYDPLNIKSTKVELVQVNDINNYVNGQRYSGTINYYLSATRTSGTFDASTSAQFFAPGFSTNSAYPVQMRYNSSTSMLSYNSSSELITISPYSGTTSRTATMTFGIDEDYSQTVTVTITQTAAAITYYLSPSSDTDNVDWQAQTYDDFSTNGTIILDTNYSNPAWCTVANNSIGIAANDNNFSQQIYSTERSGDVHVKLSEDNSKTSVITIEQEAHYFIRTEHNLSVNTYTSYGNTSTYYDDDPSIVHNGSRIIATIDNDCSNWVWWDSINQIIEVGANNTGIQREGLVTFSTPQATETLEYYIIQPGSSYYLDPSYNVTQTIDKDAQSVYQYTTNGSLMVDPNYSSTDASWLSIYTSSITGITWIYAAENGLDTTKQVMSDTRVGTLHVTIAEDNSKTGSITVTQTPTYYCRTGLNNRSGATYTKILDTSASGSLDPDIYCNGTLKYWVQNDASNWLAYDPVNALIYVTANTTGADRRGYVGFYVQEGDDDQLIYINQPAENYFRLTNMDAANSNDISIGLSGTTDRSITFSYSFDVSTWYSVTLQSGQYTWNLSPNRSIFFKSDSITQLGYGTTSYWHFDAARSYKASGNIESMIKNKVAWACTRLFADSPTLLRADDLVLFSSMTGSCCRDMFNGCTGLTAGPDLSNATLNSNCYYAMFRDCSSLTAASTLPAMSMYANCYTQMFYGCTSLTTAPNLPATSLANGCYNSMFYGCTNLENVPASLPAATLATNCYNSMFNGCSKITTGPELPALTLASNCYYRLFRNCSALRTVKCYATTIDYTNTTGTQQWLTGTPTDGNSTIYIKQIAEADYPSGENGIPTTWNVAYLI